jgi:hypothetical protein
MTGWRTMNWKVRPRDRGIFNALSQHLHKTTGNIINKSRHVADSEAGISSVYLETLSQSHGLQITEWGDSY